MSDIAFGGMSSPGRLKIKMKLGDNKPEPKGRASWEVFAKRFFVVEFKLGYVNAAGKSEALAAARSKWPQERNLVVFPA